MPNQNAGLRSRGTDPWDSLGNSCTGTNPPNSDTESRTIHPPFPPSFPSLLPCILTWVIKKAWQERWEAMWRHGYRYLGSLESVALVLTTTGAPMAPLGAFART